MKTILQKVTNMKNLWYQILNLEKLQEEIPIVLSQRGIHRPMEEKQNPVTLKIELMRMHRARKMSKMLFESQKWITPLLTGRSERTLKEVFNHSVPLPCIWMCLNLHFNQPKRRLTQHGNHTLILEPWKQTHPTYIKSPVLPLRVHPCITS